MKPNIHIVLSNLLTLVPLSAATISFTATGFNDVAQISTTGALVDAAHFGADAEADVTANGVTFVSRGGSSPTLVIGGTAGTPYYHADLYQASTHTVGYTTIAGMSETDQDLMFDSVAYGPDFGNSLVTLSGLVPGHAYEMQLLLVDDRFGGYNAYVSNLIAPPYYGPYDWSNNAVQLITGTFTADATTQTFRHYVGGNNNAQINAYQLRDTSVPEPSVSLLGGFGILALLRRRKQA